MPVCSAPGMCHHSGMRALLVVGLMVLGCGVEAGGAPEGVDASGGAQGTSVTTSSLTEAPDTSAATETDATVTDTTTTTDTTTETATTTSTSSATTSSTTTTSTTSTTSTTTQTACGCYASEGENRAYCSIDPVDGALYCVPCAIGWLDCDGDFDEHGSVGGGCEYRDRDGFARCPTP